MRDILDRFIVHEFKAIIRDAKARREQEEKDRVEAEAKCKAEAELERQSKIAA